MNLMKLIELKGVADGTPVPTPTGASGEIINAMIGCALPLAALGVTGLLTLAGLVALLALVF